MTTRDIIQKIEARLARLPVAVYLVVKARNECENIIQFRLGEDWRAHRNGEEWLAGVLSPHSSTFVDVGANVGEWTSLFTRGSHRAKRGLLIDASSCAAAKLIERFAHNTALSVIHAAVADVPGEALFYEEPDAGMTSSLIETFSIATARPAKVLVTTLDCEVARHGLSYIDMLKIDAEGYDLRVLQGAKELLHDQKIGVVQFEYNRPWAEAGSTLTAALRLLESFGYEVFLLKSTGLYTLDYRFYGECFYYANFVAVAPAKMPLLQDWVGTLDPEFFRL